MLVVLCSGDKPCGVLAVNTPRTQGFHVLLNPGEQRMEYVFAIGFLVILPYLCIQYARQEHIQDIYEEAICDVEGRLEWAHTRRLFPFGMKAQLEVSRDLLGKAKNLWKENKWQQAYRVALQSQGAMNRAQTIYSTVIMARQHSADR